ncbi:metalloregulator ArsR/SmtB family transcription factor [Glycomyces sp. TRM65418]|uniref:ArsR/SmtB family transcription factor n=1 Tax=Glycomyces sp. TRM65418 TaxID=2867006 RepID=UPI001CE676B2|nr:metalloregulator ArsR/SmtB family transcription factor [Glycomyces sp. TRM65418]MCC3763440.1 metalloregulator ArsR/SmtB family transcription factor [Glycomyces sp. TRM65418]QZD57429.1 metalloregulator ArsR/SmtB family transcription factor [Glycomyces sp. TRM65418]
MSRLIEIELTDVSAEPDEHLVQRARDLAPQFKALADENRLAIVMLLSERARTVRELTEATGLAQTLVSHHLAPLRELGLVTVTPKGRSNVYALCCDAFSAPMRALAGLSTPPSSERDR